MDTQMVGAAGVPIPPRLWREMDPSFSRKFYRETM